MEMEMELSSIVNEHERSSRCMKILWALFLDLLTKWAQFYTAFRDGCFSDIE